MSASVGVVIPAHNAERFLRAAVESVLAQTQPASSIVVVDDGSRDRTAEVAESFGPPVSCLRQKNAGVAAARNRGARALDTDWIAFLDADDFWKADKLRLQLEAAASTGAGAVFCALELVDEQGQPLGSRDDTTSLELESLLLHRDCIPQGTSSTLLVRRDLFVSIGEYDERLATMADWDLLIRLSLQSTFAYVSPALAVYRRYAGTMSRNVRMLERESLLVLDKTFSNPALNPHLRRLERSCRAWNDLVLSGSYYHDGRLEAALRFGIRAVIRDPRLAMHVLGFPWRVLKRRLSGGLPASS